MSAISSSIRCHFKVLLLVVIYDQQHLQQQHLDIYDVVVGDHLRPTTPR